MQLTLIIIIIRIYRLKYPDVPESPEHPTALSLLDAAGVSIQVLLFIFLSFYLVIFIYFLFCYYIIALIVLIQVIIISLCWLFCVILISFKGFANAVVWLSNPSFFVAFKKRFLDKYFGYDFLLLLMPHYSFSL